MYLYRGIVVCHLRNIITATESNLKEKQKNTLYLFKEIKEIALSVVNKLIVVVSFKMNQPTI